MTTRTIIARDMQEAMSQAKQQLGAEAIILNSRQLGDGIEVTVTDDPSCLMAGSATRDAANDESTSAPEVADTFEQEATQAFKPIAELPAAKPTMVSPALFDPPPMVEPETQRIDTPDSVEIQYNTTTRRPDLTKMHDPALKRLIGELRSIGEFWNEFGIYWENYAESYQYPWSKQLRERIDCLHLDSELRDRLVQQFKEIADFDEAWQLTLAELQNEITISRYDIIRNGGAYAFVGPSGAGKTTSIGKLAAEYVLQHGADQVGLITTDIFRIAAYEQLITMGKILDVDVEVVDAHQGGLVEALDRFAGKSLVLIDTAGLRRNDRDLAQQLAEIRQQGERLQTMLVLPANIQYESMCAAMETYETDEYQGCIFTRLDECNSLGAAVSLLANTGIPAAYLASGHTIPDDLAKASSLLIIEQLLSFASQETDISKMSGGSVAERLNPGVERQMDLLARN